MASTLPSRKALRDELLEQGFVVIDGVSVAAMRETITKMSDGGVSAGDVIRPTTTAQSANSSLSGIHGLEPFPWHSDGAISKRPPRLLGMLALEVPDSCASTGLLDIKGCAHVRDILKGTLVRGALPGWRSSILRASETVDGVRRWRWDPRFEIVSGDAGLAEEVASIKSTYELAWKHRRLVLIDNWRLLHRRSTVRASGLNRRLYRMYGRLVSNVE